MRTIDSRGRVEVDADGRVVRMSEFVAGLGSSAEDTAIVAAVLSMAEALELVVIAEGVETDAQLAWLRRHGCGFAQGYLLGRPAPPEQLDVMQGWALR